MQALPVRSVVLDGEGVICGPAASPISMPCAPASAATARPRHSCTRSTYWSLMAAICATSLGRVAGPCWFSSWPTPMLAPAQRAYQGRRWRGRVFRQVCVMGLEGIVAKRRDNRYRSGRCRDWIKIKNMAHPAIERAMLIALSKRVPARRSESRSPSEQEGHVCAGSVRDACCRASCVRAQGASHRSLCANPCCKSAACESE
jgi:hypothetical protein